MFDKVKQLGELKRMRDEAMRIQKQLATETIEVNEGGIRIVISGDQQVKELEINEESNEELVRVLNSALKQSQKVAARKVQEMSGGLSGLLGK